MRRSAATAAIACLAILFAGSVSAQRLVTSLSDKVVSIDSTFAGETLTLFGNVEPALDSEAKFVEGPFDVVVVVRGPAVDRAVRYKTQNLGIWLNTEQLVFKSFPSFYRVLASSRLEDIASHELLQTEGILPEARPQLSVVQGNADPKLFGDELVRLLTEKGLFGVDEHGIVFQSKTLYSAQIALPADIPNGGFLTETYLFKNKEIVSRKAEGFSVRKTGFERLLGTSARDYPLLYGLVCVAVAIFTGWLGGLIFRR